MTERGRMWGGMEGRSHRVLTRAAFVLAVCGFAASADAASERCGWIHNPTPGNWWLVDRDGEWTIATQGEDIGDLLDAVPDLTTRDWVVTNAGSYGYGCACLAVEVDAKAKRVTRIASVRQKPLAACRRDKALLKP